MKARMCEHLSKVAHTIRQHLSCDYQTEDSFADGVVGEVWLHRLEHLEPA
jgi:hypothetical protein